MLDTNIVSHIMRFPESRAADALADRRAGNVYISPIVVAELRYGIAKIASQCLLRQLQFVLQSLRHVAFDEPAAVIYADMRVSLERAGTPIGPHDMLIAAHALALNVPLITANVREFARVPNLRAENWLD